MQFNKALTAGVDSGIYMVRNKLLYLNAPDGQCLCIPDIKVDGNDGEARNLREMLIEHCYETLIKERRR